MKIADIRTILNTNKVSFFNCRAHEIGTVLSEVNDLLRDPSADENKLGAVLSAKKIDVSGLDLIKILQELKTASSSTEDELSKRVLAALKEEGSHNFNGYFLPQLDHSENKTLEKFQRLFSQQQQEWMQAAGGNLEYLPSIYNLGQYSFYKQQREGDSILDPRNPSFNIPAYFIFIFEIPARDLIGQITTYGKVKTEDVKEWLEKLTAHLPGGVESLNIDSTLLSNEYIQPKDFIPIYMSANQDLLLSLGIHKTTIDGRESLGFINQSLTKEVETYMGRKVPVYTVSNLAGNSGNASAWTNYITMSVDSLVSIEIEHREFSLWKKLNDSKQIEPFPEFTKNPQVIYPWIYMNVYGSLDLEQSLELDKQERLNEERWHSDFTAFGMAKLGKKIVFSPYMKEETVEWALTMLKLSDREESLYMKMQKLESIDEKFKFALDFCEVQAMIASLTTSPAPVITLYRSIAGVALPHLSGKYYPQGYDGINAYLTSLLSEPLLGEKTSDKSKWVSFLQKELQETGNVNALNEKIVKAAKDIFAKEFLTPEEMNTEIPGWRERADKITRFIKI